MSSTNVPSGVVQRRILRLPDLQLGGVVARDPLDGGQRVLAGDLDLAHVADVEQAGARAHGQVLVGDAGILDGHVPAAERHHAGAERDVRAWSGVFWSVDVST